MFNYPLKSSLRALGSRLSRVEVLIVDNDVEIASLVRDVMRYVGFEKIGHVRNAASALKYMRDHNPDLIITDWQRVEGTDYHLVEYIRNHVDSPNPYIPIIMFTGKAEKQDVQLARDHGVTEFLVKPFSPKRLFERLVMVIENPRSFIVSPGYLGPDRRRRTDIPPSGQERRNQGDS